MGYINDGFGWRIHPITGVRTWHNGQDYTTAIGVPITTNVPMTVVDAGWQNGYGNIVTLRDNSGNTYKFAHLEQKTVKKGQVIPPDTLIGYVGNTGGSTGPHLHFEAADAAKVSKDPMSVNPATGKLWSDVAGFKKGQTLNESITASVPDKNRPKKPASEVIADAERQKTADAKKKLQQLKEQQDRENNKTGAGSNATQRPSGADVGVLINGRTRHHDGSK